MLYLTDLPNELTDFDRSQIAAIIDNPDITIRLYKEGKEYTVVSEHPDKNAYEVTCPHIDLNQTIDNAMQEKHYLVEKDYLASIPPEENKLFNNFKNDLIITSVYNGEDLNIENLFISEFHGDIVDHEYVIYEPDTSVYLFYNPSNEHVFYVEHNEDTFLFDSLDAALKLVYEKALKENYKSPMQKKFESFLDSDKSKEIMDQLKKEVNDKILKLDEFKNSGSYDSALIDLKRNMELRNINHVCSDDFAYSPDSVSFIDEEIFYMIVDVSMNDENIYSDETNPFENYALDIKGLHVHQMIGQGIVSSISIKE